MPLNEYLLENGIRRNLVFIGDKMEKDNIETRLYTLIDGEYKNIGNIKNVDGQYECNTRYKNNDSLISKNILDTTFSLEVDKNTKFDDLDKLFGIDDPKVPNAYNIEFLRYITCRRHKKKRINKKWTKKYGQKYIYVHRIGKGWILHTYSNGEFEFVKDGEL